MEKKPASLPTTLRMVSPTEFIKSPHECTANIYKPITIVCSPLLYGIQYDYFDNINSFRYSPLGCVISAQDDVFEI